MSRYPYTEAADAMRMAVFSPDDWLPRGHAMMSRSDASRVRQFIAAAIGMDDHDLACRIADHAQSLSTPIKKATPDA